MIDIFPVCNVSCQVKISSDVIILMPRTHPNCHQDIQPWNPWWSWKQRLEMHFWLPPKSSKYHLYHSLMSPSSYLVLAFRYSSSVRDSLFPPFSVKFWGEEWNILFSNPPFLRRIFSFLLGFSDGIVDGCSWAWTLTAD